MIEIREDKEIPRGCQYWDTIYLSEYDDPDWVIYSLFVDDERLVSFWEEALYCILHSPENLSASEDRICFGAAGNGEAYRLERRGEQIVILRGYIGYQASGQKIDDTEVLADFPVDTWKEAVYRLCEHLPANRVKRKRRRNIRWY